MRVDKHGPYFRGDLGRAGFGVWCQSVQYLLDDIVKTYWITYL